MKKQDSIETLAGTVAMVSINYDTNNGMLKRQNFVGVVLECSPYKNIVMDVKRVYVRDEKNVFPLPEKENKVDMVVSLPFVGYNQYIDSITISRENDNEYVIDRDYVYYANDNIKYANGINSEETRKIRLNNLPDGNLFDNNEKSSKPIFYTNQEYYENQPEKKIYAKVYQKTIRRIA